MPGSSCHKNSEISKTEVLNIQGLSKNDSTFNGSLLISLYFVLYFKRVVEMTLRFCFRFSKKLRSRGHKPFHDLEIKFKIKIVNCQEVLKY